MVHRKKSKKSTNSIHSIFNNSPYDNAIIKKVDAFITLEYSLLLPVILGIFTLLIYMGLYLHNQCVLQTNINLLAIEGAKLYTDNNQQRLAFLQKKERDLLGEKYILVENIQIAYELKGNNITITGRGSMANPFSAFGIGNESWELRATSEVNVPSPRKSLKFIKSALELSENILSKGDGKDDS